MLSIAWLVFLCAVGVAPESIQLTDEDILRHVRESNRAVLLVAPSENNHPDFTTYVLSFKPREHLRKTSSLLSEVDSSSEQQDSHLGTDPSRTETNPVLTRDNPISALHNSFVQPSKVVEKSKKGRVRVEIRPNFFVDLNRVLSQMRLKNKSITRPMLIPIDDNVSVISRVEDVNRLSRDQSGEEMRGSDHRHQHFSSQDVSHTSDDSGRIIYGLQSHKQANELSIYKVGSHPRSSNEQGDAIDKSAATSASVTPNESSSDEHGIYENSAGPLLENIDVSTKYDDRPKTAIFRDGSYRQGRDTDIQSYNVQSMDLSDSQYSVQSDNTVSEENNTPTIGTEITSYAVVKDQSSDDYSDYSDSVEDDDNDYEASDYEDQSYDELPLNPYDEFSPNAGTLVEYIDDTDEEPVDVSDNEEEYSYVNAGDEPRRTIPLDVSLDGSYLGKVYLRTPGQEDISSSHLIDLTHTPGVNPAEPDLNMLTQGDNGYNLISNGHSNEFIATPPILDQRYEPNEGNNQKRMFVDFVSGRSKGNDQNEGGEWTKIPMLQEPLKPQPGEYLVGGEQEFSHQLYSQDAYLQGPNVTIVGQIPQRVEEGVIPEKNLRFKNNLYHLGLENVNQSENWLQNQTSSPYNGSDVKKIYPSNSSDTNNITNQVDKTSEVLAGNKFRSFNLTVDISVNDNGETGSGALETSHNLTVNQNQNETESSLITDNDNTITVTIKTEVLPTLTTLPLPTGATTNHTVIPTATASREEFENNSSNLTQLNHPKRRALLQYKETEDDFSDDISPFVPQISNLHVQISQSLESNIKDNDAQDETNYDIDTDTLQTSVESRITSDDFTNYSSNMTSSHSSIHDVKRTPRYDNLDAAFDSSQFSRDTDEIGENSPENPKDIGSVSYSDDMNANWKYSKDASQSSKYTEGDVSIVPVMSNEYEDGDVSKSHLEHKESSDYSLQSQADDKILDIVLYEGKHDDSSSFYNDERSNMMNSHSVEIQGSSLDSELPEVTGKSGESSFVESYEGENSDRDAVGGSPCNGNDDVSNASRNCRLADYDYSSLSRSYVRSPSTGPDQSGSKSLPMSLQSSEENVDRSATVAGQDDNHSVESELFGEDSAVHTSYEIAPQNFDFSANARSLISGPAPNGGTTDAKASTDDEQVAAKVEPVPKTETKSIEWTDVSADEEDMEDMDNMEHHLSSRSSADTDPALSLLASSAEAMRDGSQQAYQAIVQQLSRSAYDSADFGVGSRRHPIIPDGPVSAIVRAVPGGSGTGSRGPTSAWQGGNQRAHSRLGFGDILRQAETSRSEDDDLDPKMYTRLLGSIPRDLPDRLGVAIRELANRITALPDLSKVGEISFNPTLASGQATLAGDHEDRARNSSDKFSATTTLTVNVKDDDDQDPSFIYQGCMLHDGACINPEYTASVSSGKLSGILNISPEKIQAVDMDSISAPIVYNFLSGQPSSYKDYFEINPQTGAVRQTRPVDTSLTKRFELIVKAEEASETRRFATAKLGIAVKPVDTNPPEIRATATEGFADENAPLGTKVVDAEGRPIQLTVTDADLSPEDPKQSYSFELTTNFFQIDPNGILTVNEENLDRDPPSPGKFRFQVVAREASGAAASAPLSLTVSLNDVNDNAPKLPMIPPLTVQAGDGAQQVIKVEATDDDLGENAVLTYSIYHVSNNGRGKFKIDPETGVITTTGKMTAGEQYSITVQASDSGGKYSQTIVEVTVVPGPNTKGPVFQQSVYEVQVSEGASINSTVATITAVDPENDPVTYSIMSGNDLRQFAIGDKTGVITVIRKLDREDLTRYQLLIKAEDAGGLSSSATVNIKVTDINDKNPEFVNLPYQFLAREGEADARVGVVQAVDADEGQNAVIYYSVPADVPFAVDAMTGEVRTKVAIDFEKDKEFRFVVTAKDGAPDPRLATATVTVQVIDVDDELPIFHLLSYEARVPENVPDYRVTQVKADDPDTNQRITYMVRQGPTDLFTIDERSGIVRTLRGLDYERESQYVLVVGTLENPHTRAGATTRVIINVEDRNDIPPVFTTVPQPVTLDDDVPIGTKVTSVLATDSDGTSPGNKVRYELIGRGKAVKYFQIDPDTGVVQVRDDLRKETISEYEVDVRAYDLGEPQLSSVTPVHVSVRHVATVPPEVGLGFADDSYTVELPENATAGALVKTLTIINSRAHHDVIPIKCEIAGGNEDGLFFVNVTEEKNCQLRLKSAQLDHENRDKYDILIKLNTLSGLVNPEKGATTVTVHVKDVNDNAPAFTFTGPSNRLVKGKYFGAIPRDSQIATSVIQIQADDKDGDKYGKVEYRLLPGDKTSDYFGIDLTTGVIKSKRAFDDFDPSQLPFRLVVVARDNPSSSGDFNAVRAPVIINLIDDRHRMILVIDDAKPDAVQTREGRVAEVLEDHSHLVIGIEKVAAKVRVTNNNTLEADQSGTDVWFYAVDPDTELILERNHSRVQRSILDVAAVRNITFDVTGNLKATATGIHPPLKVTRTATAVAVTWEVFPYAIIVIACIILVLGIAGIIYICISWSKYKSYKEQRMFVVPRFDPVFVEPNNLKEYETQVLQMSVPLDDSDSYNDLQLDFSHKNHAFSLDNVSYITKENGDSIGQQSPVSSEAATTARASSVLESRRGEEPPLMPVSNPVYQRSSDDGGGQMNSSATNENVMFREKKDYSHLGFTYLGDRSPVETTTEL